MENNKDFEENKEEMTEEQSEETSQEQESPEQTADEEEEAAEQAETSDEQSENESSDEDGEDEAEEQGEEEEEVEPEPKKPMSKASVAVITAIITAVVAIFGTLVAVGNFPQIYNKYNKCANVTGRTVADIATENNVTPMKLLRQYGLPLDMPENTDEASASYYLTIGDVAKINKLSVDWIKGQLALGEEVTDDAIWGIIEDDLTLEQYIGKDDFEDFKKEYNLGSSVTLETKFKSVRGKVYKAMKAAQNGKPEKDFKIVVKYSVLYNKYNEMYIDVDGNAISDMATYYGVELSDFLEQFGLPADMPGNTSLNAAENMIPIRLHVGGEEGFASIKEEFELDDSVTADTPWGEAIKNVKVGNYIRVMYGYEGEEGFNTFKEEYGLGDEVTPDTTWGEVRDKVDAKKKEEYDAQRAGKGM